MFYASSKESHFVTRATKPWEILRGRLKSKRTHSFYRRTNVALAIPRTQYSCDYRCLVWSCWPKSWRTLNKQVICKVSLRNTSSLKKFTRRSSFWLLLDYTFIFQHVYNSGTPPYRPTTLLLRTFVLDRRKSPFFSMFFIIITITTLGALFEADIRIWSVQPEQTQMRVSFGWYRVFSQTSRWPYWCPKPVPWELNSFLMQTLSFVPINLHRCWPREWKTLHRKHACSAFLGLDQTSNFSWDEPNSAS